MKKLILNISFMFMTLIGFSCHETYLTLVSGPTDIGSGQYSTTVEVCIGQTVNWGGTFDFTMTVVGANYVSYSPAGLSNTYNAYTAAHCAGPNCFFDACGSVTANATSTSTSTVVTYTTSSSTPAGYPIVPDDVETCGTNSMRYCFNYTFVTDGVPTSISLGGNTEISRVIICQSTCGHPATYTSPCNGSYEAAMTLSFSPLPVELFAFNCYNENGVNILTWVTLSEINSDYYIIENSTDGDKWDSIGYVKGAGTYNYGSTYDFYDKEYVDTINYYRLTQFDFNGNSESFNIVVIDNSVEPKTVLKTVNFMGQEVNEYYNGMVIEIYTDNSVRKFFRD